MTARDRRGRARDAGFETISFAPIDVRPVERALLTADEIAWLNAYHARVREEVGPRVEGDVRAWLEAATAAL